MAKFKNRPAPRKPVAKQIDLDYPDDNNGEPMEGPQPLPRIDRRHTRAPVMRPPPGSPPPTTPAQSADPSSAPATSASAVWASRTRHDVSALGDAILRLPAATGRYVAVACRVRRSMETGDGWFDCLVEFLQPQPDLALRHAELCLQAVRKNVP